MDKKYSTEMLIELEDRQPHGGDFTWRCGWWWYDDNADERYEIRVTEAALKEKMT